MLGDKLYTLRKKRNISQEELAEILNTSRQAVSKWERNESKPDIDKLILIARLFNTSIDYLLSYEINYSNVDEFINKLKDGYINNKFEINADDIKLMCTKYSNNFKLNVYSADYLFIAFNDNNNPEYLDLALSCINKAIAIYTPEDSNIVSLNDLHMCVAYIYMEQHKYELAKEYIKNNNVYECKLILAKCDLALRNYGDALEVASNIYLDSTSNIINASYIQIVVLLNRKEVKKAYDLINWSTTFINSIKNNDDFFEGILYPFIFLKAACEELLNISSKESIEKIKDIKAKSSNLNTVSGTKSLKYYFGESNNILLSDSNIENALKTIISQTCKEDIHYQQLINIFKEIFGGYDYE